MCLATIHCGHNFPAIRASSGYFRDLAHRHTQPRFACSDGLFEPVKQTERCVHDGTLNEVITLTEGKHRANYLADL